MGRYCCPEVGAAAQQPLDYWRGLEKYRASEGPNKGHPPQAAAKGMESAPFWSLRKPGVSLVIEYPMKCPGRSFGKGGGSPSSLRTAAQMGGKSMRRYTTTVLLARKKVTRCYEPRKLRNMTHNVPRLETRACSRQPGIARPGEGVRPPARRWDVVGRLCLSAAGCWRAERLQPGGERPRRARLRHWPAPRGAPG